jgi:hypothetical protein
VSLPGSLWTDTHVRQGFARRDRVVSFGTVLEAGRAVLKVHLGSYGPSEGHERVVTVPFSTPSGKVMIDGPEEFRGRHVVLESGHYRLTAAQQVIGEEFVDEFQELIELYFESVPKPVSASEILVADPLLDPPAVLLEEAEVAAD